MPLVETLPVGSDTAQWTVWSTVARMVVTRPDCLADATELVRAELDAIDRACSRFRADSELVGLRAGRQSVSALLAELIGAALAAARASEGDVDPTVGAALRRLGYDRDIAELDRAAASGAVTLAARPVPGWRCVGLDGTTLDLPAGVELDLGASAKAWAADRCASMVAEQLDTGVMIGLGGDIATAGSAPAGGWRILVQDGPDDPQCTVAIPAGAAMATSSTVSRTWAAGTRHHIVDPASGLPAQPVWRTVSVVARSCQEANMLSTAAIVRGERAFAWLRQHGVAARLVDARGRVHPLGGWPC